MNNDTPETDALARSIRTSGWEVSYEYMTEHAKKLERQRSEMWEAMRECIEATEEGDWQSARKALVAVLPNRQIGQSAEHKES